MDAQHVIARRTVIGIPPDGLTPAFERDFAQFPPPVSSCSPAISRTSPTPAA
jgi:hypothetical protein